MAAPAKNEYKSNYLASGVLSFFSIMVSDKDKKAPSLLMYTEGADFDKICKLTDNFLEITYKSLIFNEKNLSKELKLKKKDKEKEKLLGLFFNFKKKEKLWFEVLSFNGLPISRTDIQIVFHQMVCL
jgi:hypothetical protein